LANARARNATFRNLRSRNTSASIIIVPLISLPLKNSGLQPKIPSIGATDVFSSFVGANSVGRQRMRLQAGPEFSINVKCETIIVKL
jgi:hypothetical protein